MKTRVQDQPGGYQEDCNGGWAGLKHLPVVLVMCPGTLCVAGPDIPVLNRAEH
jgi:hypothetical protein